MCGIWLAASTEQAAAAQLLPSFLPQLAARGPDQVQVQALHPAKQLHLQCAASLLQLRGAAPSSNPHVGPQGDLLAFNGEVFQGLDLPPGTNDGAALMQLLQGCGPEDVPKALSQLQGPWALLYWQASCHTLWFGRDVLGRRSLLVHTPTPQLPLLLLTSVAPPATAAAEATSQAPATSNTGPAPQQAAAAAAAGLRDPENDAVLQLQLQRVQLWELPPGLYSISATKLAAALATGGGSADAATAAHAPNHAAEATAAAGASDDSVASLSLESASEMVQDQLQGGTQQQGVPGLPVWWRHVQHHPWQQQLLQNLQHYHRHPGPHQPAPDATQAVPGALPGAAAGAAQLAVQQVPAAAVQGGAAVGSGSPSASWCDPVLQQAARQALDLLRDAVAERCQALEHVQHTHAAYAQQQQQQLQCGLSARTGDQASQHQGVTAVGAVAAGPLAASGSVVECDSAHSSAATLHTPPRLLLRSTGSRWYAHSSQQQLLQHQQGQAAHSGTKPPSLHNTSSSTRQQPPGPPVLPAYTPLLPAATVLLLFSGGVDSTLLAALAHQVVPPGEPVDLVNVCFDQGRSPDRLAALDALEELAAYAPGRWWRLILVNSSLSEVEVAAPYLRALLAPAATVMDLNIGAALWLAARAVGHLVQRGSPSTTTTTSETACGSDATGAEPPGINTGAVADTTTTTTTTETPAPPTIPAVPQHPLYCSAAPVVLLGHGADEQCAGYGRHRTAFRAGGAAALAAELQLDMTRLWVRNLGRDDRLVASLGREGRHPFLAEPWVEAVRQLPLGVVADLRQPSGTGDKRLLRCMLALLGLPRAAAREKRAIQFGSRIGKLSNERHFGSNRAANKQSAGSVALAQLEVALDTGSAAGDRPGVLPGSQEGAEPAAVASQRRQQEAWPAAKAAKQQRKQQQRQDARLQEAERAQHAADGSCQ